MIEETTMNTEYTTAPASDPVADEPQEPVVDEPQEPQAPVVDPKMAALEAKIAAMEEREGRLLEMLGRQQPQAPQQPQTKEPSYREEMAQYFGEKSVDGLDRLAALIEARVAARYAPRDEVEQLRHATSTVVATSIEQGAMDKLRAMGVSDTDVRAVHQEARKETQRMFEQGIRIPPAMAEYIYKAKLAEIQQTRGTAAADAAIAAKNNVAARAQRSGTPSAPAPSGKATVELSEDELRDGSLVDLLRNPKLKAQPAR